MNFIINFIRFARLHTVIGTVLSVFSLYRLAVANNHIHSYNPGLLILTILACLGANIYIVGLNQITDVEIDRINKPHLPLASGAFSMRLGYFLIFCFLLLSLLISLYYGGYLMLTVLFSLALGTVYSLPPIRLKRFAFWAAFCIIAVRAFIVNLLLFLHFSNSLYGKENIPYTVWLLTWTIFVFSIVIAWFKDIPDMEGDRKFNIRTLSLNFGAKKVFFFGNAMISLVYLSLIMLPFYVAFKVELVYFTMAHLFFLIALWLVVYKVDLASKKSITSFYQFIWLLFFLEYVTFAFATY
jgi:homogentisate phytyltransferase/homogentisate geranylgeranyltransferase